MPLRESLAKFRGTAAGHGSSEMLYGAMSLRDIKEMPIEKHAADNSHLYLWTTNSFMEEAYEVARAWGFLPKTIITWTKIRKKDAQPSMKMGWYYRGATEHCLFCLRGTQRLLGPPASTALFTERLPHSVKPDEFYQMVEIQSPAPRLELFSRQTRIGWDSWGNQAANSINLYGAAL